MLTLGCHLSASKGYLHMGREAAELGGNTFQFFTRNPRGGNAKELDLKDVEIAGAQDHVRIVGRAAAEAKTQAFLDSLPDILDVIGSLSNR